MSEKLNERRRETIALNSEVMTLKKTNKDLIESIKGKDKLLRDLKDKNKEQKVELDLLRSDREALRKESSKKVYCSDLLDSQKKVENFFAEKERQTKDEIKKMIQSSQQLAEVTRLKPISTKREELIKLIKKETAKHRISKY